MQALQAGRQTDRREDLWAAGLLHYLGPAIRELTLATLLGLKTTKSVNSEQAIPRPSTPGRRPPGDSTRPEDQGRGSEEQQCLIGLLDSAPAVLLLTPRSNVSGPVSGRWAKWDWVCLTRRRAKSAGRV
jgi:hypothetical protein